MSFNNDNVWTDYIKDRTRIVSTMIMSGQIISKIGQNSFNNSNEGRDYINERTRIVSTMIMKGQIISMRGQE